MTSNESRTCEELAKMQEHLLTDMTPFIALSILLWVIMANKELIEAHHTNRENEAKCFRVDQT